jgi:hypothetical protein
MSGSKNGSTTQTVKQDSTPWNSQYLSNLFNSAQDLYSGNKVPYYNGETYYVDPGLTSAYDALKASTSWMNSELVPTADYTFKRAADGNMGVYSSPAYGGLSAIGNQSNGSQVGTQTAATGLDYYGRGDGTYNNNLVQNAANAVSGNRGLADLTYTADGHFLGANPYLDNMYNSAANAVTRAYQTATAPQTDSLYERAGRYGSGAMTNAREQNQNDLGDSLSRLASNIYGQDYSNERSLMDQAASNLATGYTGATNASTEAANAGLGNSISALKGSGALTSGMTDASNQAYNALQSGFDTGNKAALQGLSLEPTVLQGSVAPAQTLIDAAKGMTTIGQGYDTDLMNRYYGQLLAPWEDANRYSALLGNPITGTSKTTSPLYNNTAAGVLGTGLAGASLLGQTGAFGNSGWLSGNNGWLSGLWGGGTGSAISSGSVNALSALAAPTVEDAAWASPSLLSLIGIL